MAKVIYASSQAGQRMSFEPLSLSVALSDNERTRPLIQGRIPLQGMRWLTTVVHPSEMFWRQLKFAEFDLCEMSLASLLISASHGDRRFVALPIFTTRFFSHTWILVRADAGIATSADLKGKRVGVPEYQQTSAVWSRGILEHEFGVRPRDIEWFMERGADRSHGGATGFKPPPGVRLNAIAPTTDIGQMLLAGELDASLLYLPERNLVDRSRADLSATAKVRPLFADTAAEGRRYFAKTGIYPINHAVVVRRELLERHPWLAINVYHAFVAAKEEVEREARESVKAFFETGLVPPEYQTALDADPKPYGLKSSRKVVETIAQYVHEQGLTQRAVALEEVFAPQAMEL